MKLPSGQNSPQPSSVNPSQKLAVEKSSAQAAQILARLNNTWVKVEKSEPLSKEQSQQALSNSALNGRNTTSKQASQPNSQTEQSQQALSNSALNGRNTTNKQASQPNSQTEQRQQASSNNALNDQNTANKQTSEPTKPAEQNRTQPTASQNQTNQSRQAIIDSQLKGQNIEPNKPPAVSAKNEIPLSETDTKLAKQLNTLKSQLQALNDNQTNNLTSQLKLNLITLKHNSGSIRLLSPQNYPINSEVLIKQDVQGAWALHKPSGGFTLNNFAVSHASILSKPLALFDLHQTQQPHLNLLDKLNIQLPKLSLSSAHTPNSQNIQTAINTSGQFFERHLHQAFTPNKADVHTTLETNKPALNLNLTNTQGAPNTTSFASAIPASIRSVFPASLTATNAPEVQTPNTNNGQASAAPEKQTANQQNHIGQNLNQKIKQVDTLINKWVSQLLPNHKSGSAESSNQATAIKQNSINTQLTGAPNNTHTADKTLHKQTTQLQTPLLAATAKTQDMKAWLINSQQQLVKHVIAQAQNTHSNDKSGDQQNKLQQLSSLFTLLLQPKTASSEKAISIWPSNLSAQQQLTLLIAQQAPVINTVQKEQDELSRLLLNISQQLNRLQGEQVNNRLHQQQNPESNQLQMSLPYLHEEQVHWCQMEWQGEEQQAQDKEQAFSWHLVLRFAQHQSSAFAIESQMMQNQLHITLWAEQQDQLKHLHQHMNVLQTRLTETGFNVSSLKSKHGMPPLKSNPISSSLVDVHT